MSTFLLKVLAILFMLIDHMYRLLPGYPLWYSYIGRLAAPIFFFLIIEGFYHTQQKQIHAAPVRLRHFDDRCGLSHRPQL